MHSDVLKDPAQYHRLVQVARQHLEYIETHPSPEFEKGSKPHLAFDPYIGRRLNTFIPMRVIPVPSSKQTWHTIRRLLDGWQELSLLAQCHSISIWEVWNFTSVCNDTLTPSSNRRWGISGSGFLIPLCKHHTSVLSPRSVTSLD